MAPKHLARTLIVLAMGGCLSTAMATETEQAPTEVVEEAPKKKKKKPVLSYKPGKGFRLETADERFSLRIRARLQLLYRVEVDRSEEDPTELQHGFEVRRARLGFDGNVFGEDTRYKIVLAVSPSDVGLQQDGFTSKAPLLAASITFEQIRDFEVRLGQFAVSYNRQRNVASKRLQFIERSSISRAMDFGYDLGFQFASDDLGGVDRLRYRTGIVFGEGRSLLGLTDFGMLYSARVEVFPLGIYKAYDGEGDVDRSRKPRLGLGVAYAAEHLAPDDDDPPLNSHHLTGDLQFLYQGLSMDASVLWETARQDARTLEREGIQTFVDADGRPVGVGRRAELGWHVQVGYVLPPIPLEFAARYAELRPLPGEDPSRPRHEVGGAINWLIEGHPYKLQLDYLRLWRQGLITGGDDQVRLQVQVSL